MNLRWTLAILLCILKALFVSGADSQTDGESNANAEESARFAARVQLKGSKSQMQLTKAMEELRALRERANALEGENRLLREDLRNACEGRDVLHKELVEILKVYSDQETRYKKVTAGIAAAFAGFEKLPFTNKDIELLESLKDVCGKSRELSVKSAEFIASVKPVLDKMPLESVERAKLKIISDELQKKIADTNSVTESGSKNNNLGECRILAVSDSLNVAVVNAGRNHGVINGMSLYCGKNRDLHLRVMEVRPYIAAVAILKGDIKEIVPGMNVYTSKN